MDSFPSQPIGRYRVQQSTQPFNAQLSSASSANRATPAEPEFYGVYTGEYRVPIRDRIRHLRECESVPETLSRPDTPIPSKRATSGLLTPPMLLPSLPECPAAPSKKRTSGVRRVSQRQHETDEDILLDRKSIERTKKLAPFPFPGVRRQYVSITPESSQNTPLRQSWGPLELAQIDLKLQALLSATGEGER
ncbi:hypothetical protein F4859DRAFT_101283 [Xylaria cf. heliscus]|nr:hypothetical protein F4859DRAFT_101283 [Xylaria cf. heliscus]